MAIGRVMRKILLIIFIICLCSSAFAADQTLYVRDGAAGTGTGADWTNACDELSDCEAKIDRATYDNVYIYVADGSYTGVTIDAAVHGTDMIYIKKAVVAEGGHGSATGWDNGYGDGQATFQWDSGTTAEKKNTIIISTSYVTFDGVSGTGTDYGFIVKPPLDFGDNSYSSGDIAGIYAYALAGQSNVTVTHVFVDGPGEVTPDCLDWQSESGLNFYCASYGLRQKANSATRSSNIHFVDNYVEGWTNNIVFYGATDSEIKGNYATANTNGTYIHGQNIDVQVTDDVSIYNNIVHDSQVFAISFHGNATEIASRGYSTLRTKVFNNIVDGMTGATLSMCIGSGSYETNSVRNAEVHHNTFVNVNCGTYGLFHLTATSDASSYHSNFYNNLMYAVANPIIDADTENGIVHDYNACLACTGTNSITGEDHDQSDASAADPFTNLAGGDYTINATVDAANAAHVINTGYNLEATYDTDKAGNPRDATPTIGAYEYAYNPSYPPHRITGSTVRTSAGSTAIWQ
jgi:hypothetical protein